METVTKQTIKTKNPKRVEQGKRLAEHNQKMKQQLAQMQKTESTEPSIQSSQASIATDVDPRLFYWGGLVILEGLGLLALKHFNKPQPQPQIQMSPAPPTELDTE